jgi:hypothetical protein
MHWKGLPAQPVRETAADKDAGIAAGWTQHEIHRFMKGLSLQLYVLPLLVRTSGKCIHANQGTTRSYHAAEVLRIPEVVSKRKFSPNVNAPPSSGSILLLKNGRMSKSRNQPCIDGLSRHAWPVLREGFNDRPIRNPKIEGISIRSSPPREQAFPRTSHKFLLPLVPRRLLRRIVHYASTPSSWERGRNGFAKTRNLKPPLARMTEDSPTDKQPTFDFD